MKKIMFYCQHVSGMGHFIRSMEIVRGLKDFDVCFLSGGEVAWDFELPPSVEMVNLPPIRFDEDFKDIQSVDNLLNLNEVKEVRKERLLCEFERVRPDIIIFELFPFGRRKFTFELVPLLDRVLSSGRSTKVVCSLRDILVSKRDQTRYEEQVCDLMNQYFDLLLIHSDPSFQRLEDTFSRVKDIKCEIRYTGFVVQRPQQNHISLEEDTPHIPAGEPFILVSIGGGRIGYKLLECAIESSHIVEETMPHRMLIFTGPYMPDELLLKLQCMVEKTPNIKIHRYTPQFLSYMEKAALSISLAGYNTCMNIITTGVKALILPLTGINKEEQTIRADKLEKLGIVATISPQELHPDCLAEKIIRCLKTEPISSNLDVNGVNNTAFFLTDLLKSDVRLKRMVVNELGPREGKIS